MFGLALALIVLIVVFGGVAAAVVPIAVAVASIVVALAVVAGIGQAFALNFIVVNVLVMMGLAVGIDYSLFVVSRFREERRAGRELGDAVAVAGATANRAVLFSGATVVLALSRDVPRAADDLPLDRRRARSPSSWSSVLAALTLLPAALAVLGDRIERLRVPLLGRRAGAGFGRAWPPWRCGARARASRRASRCSSRSPCRTLGIETGTAGVGTLPESFQTRAAYEAIEDAFGPQGTAAAEVVVRGRADAGAARGGRAACARRWRSDARLRRDDVAVAPGAAVTRVTVPVDGDAAGRRRWPRCSDLRERYVPHAFAGVDAEALVGGQSADELDFAGSRATGSRSCSRSCSG